MNSHDISTRCWDQRTLRELRNGALRLTEEKTYDRFGRLSKIKSGSSEVIYYYGVCDGKGNVVEEYVYDPAGNILKKTIQGRTTTYKYDKANQLVSSECNGKVTKYEYDAAGRLVKEGDKVYSYIGLDKIESVTEGGQKLSSFTYHIDGQLAEAVTPEKRESFQWDGLALIQRNSTNYVNEPAVTGGNPILADDKVLFNDMLGTTLGIKDGDKVMQNNLTAFGESLNSSLLTENSFFTGKPYIGELGYTFLFRNYRSDQGKWNSQDPVALSMTLPTAADFSKNSSFVKALGYPDGWNNLAYVNNNVIMYIDWSGCGWIPVSDSGIPSPYSQEPYSDPLSDVKLDPGYIAAQVVTTISYDYVLVDTISDSIPSNPLVGETYSVYYIYIQRQITSVQIQWRDLNYNWVNQGAPTVTIRNTGNSVTRKVTYEFKE